MEESKHADWLKGHVFSRATSPTSRYCDERDGVRRNKSKVGKD